MTHRSQAKLGGKPMKKIIAIACAILFTGVNMSFATGLEELKTGIELTQINPKLAETVELQIHDAIAKEALKAPSNMPIADVRRQGITRVEISDKAYSWVDGGRLYSYIPGLERDLFQEFVTKPSRGPNWKESAIGLLENEFDFHENSSYWGERYGGECDGFSEYDLQNAENTYGFEWLAVKSLRDSRVTVMYIMEYYTVIYSGNKTCNILEREHLFLNKIVEGAPVYLGIREYAPVY